MAKSWVTDRMLLVDSFFPKDRFIISVPDAIWVTQTGRRVAIEYERTLKRRDKIGSKISGYARELLRTDRIIDLVLWFLGLASKAGITGFLGGCLSQLG